MPTPPQPHIPATSGPQATGVRPRPPLLRALGNDEPPTQVDVAGKTYDLVKVFKHDSWAATALYQGEGGQIVCKFNRRQRIGIVPMGWLGRHLARNERAALVRLGDLANVPAWSGEVQVGAQVQRNAVAHPFIPGRPLGKDSVVADGFFPELRTALDALHRQGMAYVDLHKRENVLIGDDGRPYLIDFQIAFVPPANRFGRLWPVQALLRAFQRSDDYHYLKLVARLRPDQSPVRAEDLGSQRPWYIRLHRLVAVPFRTLRRGLLARLKVRDRRGRSSSETFAEEAVRLEQADHASRAA